MPDITRSVRGRKHPRNPGAVDNVLQYANLQWDSFTKSVLHFNVSTGFTDELGRVWTPSGNPQIDTGQSKFGGASYLSDGTGDALSGDGHSDFVFGTGNFTVDFWLRLNALNALKMIFDCRPNLAQGVYPTIYLDSTNVLVFYTNTSVRITGTTTLTTGAWYHVALSRDSGTTRLFLNGTQQGSSYADTNNYLCAADKPALMNGYDYSLYSVPGQMDEFRISKGVARWTANFTPPTSEYAPS